ncbi:DUF1244 domain-containing protein [Ferrimonas lipolytica]|uniref:DUF1244 domain-containing protein n=1 Tax=Ferrimonas lipolytica TaxID=2724191 RepID=A0A6H1UGN9_9GAMM|nr:DUF1244 domain-containing protein [Ferrimonas lipolytica]QIZ78275.1 DUF1244 domain-containing protein [Ferrimonas lipolytica]
MDKKTEVEAAVLRRLLAHLDANKDVQNIDLMILSGFCRNCLSKWYKAAADDHGLDVSDDDAREAIYGMPYSEWKANHQPKATDEQLTAYNARQHNLTT